MENLKSSSKSKRYRKSLDVLANDKTYTLQEAAALMKTTSTAKFDETVEFVVRLGVNPAQSDQQVRGVVGLTHGTGKKVRVAVFVKDESIDGALKAGADVAGGDSLVEQILAGNINFDVCIASPSMMPTVSKVAKILGPKGIMPNPKLGTVTDNHQEAIKKVKAGQIQFRTDKAGIIHAGIAKASFAENQIIENARDLVLALVKAKPSGAKGVYLKSMYMTSTMGPSVKVDVSSIN